MHSQDKIRNVAIIAHVDHGKTTLVDAILKQTNVFRSNEEEMKQTQILDSGDLERERGITISAKNIAVTYGDYRINIIDTPGHADFGGEVERTLNMAESCILVVDAQEGPMIQTRVVLRKALELGLRPIVVINKIDKKFAETKNVLSRIQDLFLTLAHREDQLEFPVFYAIAKEGKVFTHLPEGNAESFAAIAGDVKPLLDKIIEYVPPTVGDVTAPFQMQVSSLEFDSHNGRYLIGKIRRGIVKKDDPVVLVADDEHLKVNERGRVKKLMIREGLKFIDVPSAGVGEIVAIVGVDSTAIGATLCDFNNPDPVPTMKISPPSIEVKIEPNTSPFVGRDGKFVTASQLSRRLEIENDLNVSIDIKPGEGGSSSVFVRGELQLSILVETLRREGYEMQVRKPTIVYKKIDGVVMEPIEELSIEVSEEVGSTVIQELTQREAELVDMHSKSGKTFFEYKILTRKLLGLRNVLVTQTKGNLVFNSAFLDYVPFEEKREAFKRGMLISSSQGEAREYSLNTIQERGSLFVKPSDQVYEGMIIGINKYENDLEVNPTKERQKTGVRMNHAEITLTSLQPPMQLTLENALTLLSDDEMLEVTPSSLRLRKIYLTKTQREWSKRKNLTAFAKQQMGIS
jgi:GTP-binding protein